MTEPPTWPHEVDARLLGLEILSDEPAATRFTLEPKLCRGDGGLFGGTALAATLASFEIVSSRPALWATVQFVGAATQGDVIDVCTSVVARGRYVDQLQATATVGGRLVFSALGSTATRRPDGITGLGHTMPVVVPPEALEPMRPGRAGPEVEPMGHYLASEFREIPADEADRPGRLLMWARVLGESTTTAASLGFLADMVPLAVCRAVGVQGAGTSLDNTLRVGHLVDTEWVLVELDAHVADGGYGYGVSHMWSPDGTLMATGSQTAKLFSFDAFLAKLEGRPVTGRPGVT